METIGLSMIIKDEPIDRLAMLVDYLKPVVSEFVFSDTGSETIDLDEPLWNSWGVKVWRHEWTNDFAAARNSTLQFMDSEWVLHLDADELPSLGMIDHLKWVAGGNSDQRTKAWLFWTINFWGGERGISVPAHWHCRLFRRVNGRWYKKLHEQVAIDGMYEESTRNSIIMKSAPEGAYVIHSKPREKIDASARLYASIEGSR